MVDYDNLFNKIIESSNGNWKPVECNTTKIEDSFIDRLKNYINSNSINPFSKMDHNILSVGRRTYCLDSRGSTCNCRRKKDGLCKYYTVMTLLYHKMLKNG